MKLLQNKRGITLTVLTVALIAVIALNGTIAYFTDYDEVTNTFTMGDVKISLEEPGWNDEGHLLNPDLPEGPDNPYIPGDGENLLPGSVRTKDPTVTATEGQSYMRVRMEIVDGDGSLITDINRINLILATLFYDKAYGTTPLNIDAAQKYKTSELQTLITAGKIQAEYNKDAFAFAGVETGKPGVRYYNYITNGGIFDAVAPADTAVLFTNVVVPRDWNNQEVFELNGSAYETAGNGSIEVTVPGNGYKIVLKAEAVQAADMANAAEAFAALNEATNVTIDASDI